MVGRYGRFPTAYEQIANWPFIDFMLNFGEETILSTIKIRQAGFADCIDTHEEFTSAAWETARDENHPVIGWQKIEASASIEIEVISCELRSDNTAGDYTEACSSLSDLACHSRWKKRIAWFQARTDGTMGEGDGKNSRVPGIVPAPLKPL
jgi:hypothetical protein